MTLLERADRLTTDMQRKK